MEIFLMDNHENVTLTKEQFFYLLINFNVSNISYSEKDNNFIIRNGDLEDILDENLSNNHLEFLRVFNDVINWKEFRLEDLTTSCTNWSDDFITLELIKEFKDSLNWGLTTEQQRIVDCREENEVEAIFTNGEKIMDLIASLDFDKYIAFLREYKSYIVPGSLVTADFITKMKESPLFKDNLFMDNIEYFREFKDILFWFPIINSVDLFKGGEKSFHFCDEFHKYMNFSRLYQYEDWGIHGYFNVDMMNEEEYATDEVIEDFIKAYKKYQIKLSSKNKHIKKAMYESHNGTLLEDYKIYEPHSDDRSWRGFQLFIKFVIKKDRS